MDADDVSHPERLRRQLSLLERAGKDCVGVGTWIGLINARAEPFGVIEATATASTRVALERGLLPHATLIARREWLLANPYDETLTRAEDRDLWCRTVHRSRFAIVPEPLYVYRVMTNHPTFLRDYVESHRQNRILYRRYGPASVGWRRTAFAFASSLAKSSVMRLAVPFGMAERLVQRRGRLPTELERRMIEEALASARAT
jgi:hypothetical protein